MRILVSNIATAAPAGAAADYLRQTLVPVTQRNAGLVRAPDTQLVFRFCTQGQAHPAFAQFRYLPLVNPLAMRTAVGQAAAEGYDAAILGCFGDPYLRECRADVGIPVTGFGEASMLLATTLGERFGIVASSPLLVEPIRRQVAAMGLAGRLAGVHASGEPACEQEAALHDARQAIAHFQVAARELIAAGADVIIPGCGLLSPALRLAPGAEPDHPRGCIEVDGVPVLDVIAAAVLMAESMVRLGATRGAQRAASEAPVAATFWDCA